MKLGEWTERHGTSKRRWFPLRNQAADVRPSTDRSAFVWRVWSPLGTLTEFGTKQTEMEAIVAANEWLAQYEEAQ